jgi:capsular exopolysaccharide synthesis family protein
LFEYWRVIRENLGWFCLLTAIGVALGWVAATLEPAMYQARTVLDIRSLNEDILSAREGSGVGTTDSVLPESYLQTEIKILQSDSLSKRALDRLPNPKQFAAPPVETPFWRSALGLLDPASIPRKQLLADAGKRIKVRALGNTRIVEILCAARDAQLAADVCNSLANTYIAYNIESRYESTKETGDWLQGQLADVRKRLTTAESELKDEARDTALLIDSEGDNMAQEKLRQLQTQLARSQSERMAHQSEYDAAVSSMKDSLSSIDSEPLREYRMRLTDLKRQLAEASATMTPEHYHVQELKMQVSEMQDAIAQEQREVVNRLKVSYDTAMRQEDMIQSVYDKQASQVSEHGDKAVRYTMLKREVDTERKLYEQLLQKMNEVALAAALHTSSIHVVDPATPPGGPYSPNQPANLAVGLLGGACLGFVLSFVRLRSDRTLRSPGEASFVLRLRELGVIPSAPRRSLRLRMMRQKALPVVTSLELASEVGPDKVKELQVAMVKHLPASSVALAAWHRNPPEMAEAFSGAMNSLLFASDGGSAAQVIVLTSPEPGDGKTTVATNLAIALAQIGRRVILVDGDLRKPRMHDIFGLEFDGGLARILEGKDSIDQQTLSQSVFETEVRNLSVLPTTAASEGISAKLHSGRMRTLLEQLRRQFEVIVIDSPPMLHVSDARVLGWLADGVLLVLRSRKTTRDAALAANDCLLQDGITVLGTILNDWNPKKSGGPYKGYGTYLRSAS